MSELGGGLGVRAVEDEGGWSADRLEQGAGEAGEGEQAAGVDGLGVVEGLDEQLAQELADVMVIEKAGITAGAAARGGTAFGAGFGEGLGVAGIVEEAESTAGQGTGGAGG